MIGIDKSKVKSQKSKVKSQKSKVKSQKSKVKSQRIFEPSKVGKNVETSDHCWSNVSNNY
ncbi:hypothetical protein DN068_07785 [Taibaiella soli]|uniref:Uncharacterized protein n=1 Tax=Taibaiella soli TaxID=1649169 RepID=A0A2W2B036_9BACT|nr:hypothetical protein DN068_07785 [Taibaiella soli]